MKKIFTYIFIFFFAMSLSAEAKTVKIAQITDVDLSTNGELAKESQAYLEAAIKSVNSQKDINFVVFTGNNINKSTPENLIKFAKIARKIKKPYYILLGNKDSHKIAGIPKKKYIEAIKKFNKNQPVSFSFKFDINNDIKAIFVDTAPPNVLSTHGCLSNDTTFWLKKLLSENKNKKIIIFQHHPILPPNDDPHLTMLQPEEYQMLLIRNPNILFVASGNYDLDSLQIDENGITHLSTPSLLTSKKYRIIEINYQNSPFGKADNFKIKTTLVDI